MTGSLFGLTLADAQRAFEEKLPDGTTCPCCRRYARVYKRKLNSGIALALLWICRAYLQGGREPVDLARSAPRYVLARGGQHGLLVHWGLAATSGAREGDHGRTSGLWTPTADGLLFAAGRSKVRRFVHVFANRVAERSGPLVTIGEALADRFDYAELQGTPLDRWGEILDRDGGRAA